MTGPTKAEVLAAIDASGFITGKHPTKGDHEAVYVANEGKHAAREAVEKLFDQAPSGYDLQKIDRETDVQLAVVLSEDHASRITFANLKLQGLAHASQIKSQIAVQSLATSTMAELVMPATERLHDLVSGWRTAAGRLSGEADQQRDGSGLTARKVPADWEAEVYAQVADQLEQALRDSGLTR
jgi:hypothetical protein